jgi:hypothetical protein
MAPFTVLRICFGRTQGDALTHFKVVVKAPNKAAGSDAMLMVGFVSIIVGIINKDKGLE